MREAPCPDREFRGSTRLTIADVERMLDTLAAQGSRRDGKGRPFGRATLGKLRATTIQILEFARRREWSHETSPSLPG